MSLKELDENAIYSDPRDTDNKKNITDKRWYGYGVRIRETVKILVFGHRARVRLSVHQMPQNSIL